MRFIHGVLTCGILLAVLAAPALAGPIEKLLPEDTVLFLTVENVSASKGRLEASALYELWSEAEFQNFLSKPLEKFKEALAEKETELGGAGIFDVLEWIEGQFAFAITGTREVSSKKQILVFAMLMEIGDNEAKLRDWMEKLEPPAFGPEEFRRVEEDFRGTTIVSYLSRKDEDVDDPTAEDEGLSAGPPCWFVHEGLFAFADDPEALKAILVRRGGDEEGGLNTNAHYKTVLERCEGAGDLFMYFNLESTWGMLEGLKGADQSLAMALTAEVEQILTAIGVKEPQAGGMSMGFTDQGMIQRAFLESPAPRTGIMKFLDGENSGLQPPSFVPQDVTTAMTLAIDFQEIWKEARRIMDEIQPGMTEQMDDQFAQIKEQAGLDIEQDLIESLGKSITLYQFEPIPADPDAAYPIPTQRTVLAVEVSNAEKVKEALGILLQMSGATEPDLVEEEYLGVKLHVLDAGIMKMAFSVAADHLIMATVAEDMRAIIRTLGRDDVKSLASSVDYGRAMQSFPRACSGIIFSDPRRSLESMSDQLGMLGQMIPGISEWLDMSLFPSEIMKKYLDVSGGVIVNHEDGILMVSLSLMGHPNQTDKPEDR